MRNGGICLFLFEKDKYNILECPKGQGQAELIGKGFIVLILLVHM